MALKFDYTLPEIPRDFRTMLDETCANWGERDGYIVKTKRETKETPAEYRHVTFNEFRDEVRALAEALREMFPAGSHIGVMGENRYEWCLSYLAVTCGGNVVVPVDRELNKEELIHVLGESGSCCIIVSDKVYKKALIEALPELPELKVCVLMDKTPEEGEAEQPELPYKLMRLDALLNRGKELVAGGANTYYETPIDRDAMSVLIFTSGTTGVSKGVMLSQKNILTDIDSVLSTLTHSCEDSMMSLLPMHHTYECTTTFLVSLRMGACVSFCDGLRYISQNLKEYRPTMLMLVPLILENMYSKIEKQARSSKLKWIGFNFLLGLSGFLRKFGINAGKKFFKAAHEALGGRIRLVVAGAAAMDPVICRKLENMGFKVRQGYGLTETSPILCVNRDNGNEYYSVGPAMPGIKIRIADPDSEGKGEIQAIGDNVMLGYYKNEAATRATFTEDGWFRTGDQGMLDKYGRLRITGRIKNIIVTNTGKNIYPEELEAKLMNIPYVAECIVWGDGSNSEEDTRVCATAVPDMDAIASAGGEATEEGAKELIWKEIKKINRDLPAYKRICDLEISLEPFAKTSTHKVQRFKIKHNTAAAAGDGKKEGA